ncbi:MAG: DoxX family protein [bacterium]|nr:DoxX family protein [bacterium]
MRYTWFKEHSLILLRYGVALLFLWFGLNQLFNPGAWVAWLPSWTSNLPIEPVTFILLNGFLETVLGFCLVVGVFTRFSALLLSLHLFGIAFSLGYGDIAVRDFSLAIATMAVAFHGSDKLSYDKKLRKSWWGHTSAANFLYLYEKEESSS